MQGGHPGHLESQQQVQVPDKERDHTGGIGGIRHSDLTGIAAALVI
jgi:hypothetical protein